MPRPFTKGNPGRPKGSLNKSTVAIKEAAAKLLEDPDYVASLKMRLRRGTAGAVEPLLYHYAYGKPKETVALENGALPLVLDLVTDRRQLEESDSEDD